MSSSAGGLERLRAEIAFTSQRGRDAPLLLLEAARRLDPLDTALARETYLEAITSAMFAGRLGTGPDEREVAEAARASRPVWGAGAADLLLDGLVTRFTEGYAPSVVPLSRALRALADADGDEADARWLWLACRLAQDLWDDELWHLLATRAERVARDTGALGLLANALNYAAAFNVHAGAFATAAVQVDEVAGITHATGLPPLEYAATKLAVLRSDQAAFDAIFDHGLPGVTARGEGSAIGLMWSLTAGLHNSRGQYGKALVGRAAGVRVRGRHGVRLEPGRAGRGRRPRRTAGRSLCRTRSSERTHAGGGTEWALGVEARSRALLSDDEASYRESIERLSSCSAAVELARSRLVYGEWLRRQNRRTDARELLRSAHESFSHMGAEAFAERARRELLATGETARRRTADTRDTLTPQELQVARLARDGHTNPEIGAQLFISPRTVEYHLGKVFVKLGIKNRKDLRDALADPTP